jgi:hypothetical protein
MSSVVGALLRVNLGSAQLLLQAANPAVQRADSRIFRLLGLTRLNEVGAQRGERLLLAPEQAFQVNDPPFQIDGAPAARERQGVLQLSDVSFPGATRRATTLEGLERAFKIDFQPGQANSAFLEPLLDSVALALDRAEAVPPLLLDGLCPLAQLPPSETPAKDPTNDCRGKDTQDHLAGDTGHLSPPSGFVV